MTTNDFHVPRRPFSPIDALNRRAAATGSPQYAMATSNANYNGHRVTVAWNSYRKYYVAEYFWGGRVVLARGDFHRCLAAALCEYDRGALGAEVWVSPEDPEAVAACEAHERLLPGRGGEEPWFTWRHATAARCARDSANPRMPVMVFDWDLLQAAQSEPEYVAALKDRHGRIYQ